MMHPWPGGAWGGPHLDFSWLWPLMIVFFALGGWRRFAGGPPPGHDRRQPELLPLPPGDPAFDTLRERFARGEIDRAEYEERRAALLSRQAAPHTAGRKPGDNVKPDDQRPEWPDLV